MGRRRPETVGHDTNTYAQLLKLDGTMVLVVASTALEPLMGYAVIGGRKSIFVIDVASVKHPSA